MKFIGISDLWHGDVSNLTTAIDKTNAKATVTALIGKLTKVKNVHGDTFAYTQDDDTTTEYKNGLTGGVYHIDITEKGKHTIAWTEGEYDLKEKAALQGGTEDGGVWADDGSNNEINKIIVAKTKQGHYIIFTYAKMNGKVDTQEKALGLGVSATAQEHSNAAIAPEYWVSADLMK